jgi:hypothetical protein
MISKTHANRRTYNCLLTKSYSLSAGKVGTVIAAARRFFAGTPLDQDGWVRGGKCGSVKNVVFKLPC